MKIFIDSAKLEEIIEADSLGVLDGVTTNPSLIKQAVDELKGEETENYIKKILKLLGKGRSVSLEVVSADYANMAKEGVLLYEKFNRVAGNVYIKIPVNPSFSFNANELGDGIRAIKFLSGRKIPVNCTLIFTPEQALMAAKAGARVVSPFAGRLDDYLRKNAGMKFNKEDYFSMYGLISGGKKLNDDGIVSGVDLVGQIVSIFKKYDIKCEVLAASIRNARQLRECALVGADISTAPLETIKKSLEHVKTIEGMQGFTNDVVPEYSKLFRK